MLESREGSSHEMLCFAQSVMPLNVSCSLVAPSRSQELDSWQPVKECVTKEPGLVL